MKKQLYTLSAEVRDMLGKKVSVLRQNGSLPAVVYGAGGENQNLTLDLRSFEKIYRGAGESSLVQLVVHGADPANVIIHDVQTDPLLGKPIHVDLYRVNMSEKLTTHIPLMFIGESKAVREQGGILVKNIDEIEVKCLPGDLVPEIEVNLEPLTELEFALHIKDLNIPAGIEIVGHHDPLDIVVIVTPPVSEEALKKMEEEGAVQAPTEGEKSEEKGRKEEPSV